MSNVYSKISRCREWLFWFAQKNQQSCHFCNEPINPESFLAGDTDDGILIHHADHNRSNNHPSNLVITHRSCHRKYHIAHNKKMAELDKLQVA